MEIEQLIVKIIVLLIFLMLSAFFSGSETAYFSLSKILLLQLEERESKNANRVAKLMKNPRQLLITILTGNTIVNVALATFAALFAAEIGNSFQIGEELIVFLEVLVITFVILIVGEVTPKVIAVKNAMSFSQKVSLPLYIFSFILSPISFILTKFTEIVARALGVNEEALSFSEEELRSLIEARKIEGSIEEEESEMIHSIFEFTKTSVKEIMVPRIDMVCVEKNSSLEKLMAIIKERGHTRIPLYEDRVDNILGIVHAKDLLNYINLQKRNFESEGIDLVGLARPVHFIPESKMIDELLKEFQHAKTHMAIVVDEYGGTAGLITLEDVIEEIVGEIQDEYDKESPLVRQIDEKTYIVNAKINIHELEQILEQPIPADGGYETLAGLIFSLTGYVPREKELIAYGKFDFIVEKIEKNRILQVRVVITDRVEEDLPSSGN
ncbi:HlyC/CorC family transporter [candidate division KSB1 bacterium]|nr:HlyC/CorC family transporter [candidate division KSB1 bacterium]